MTINFFNNKSDSNVVNKTLTQLFSVNAELKQNTSILNPTLRIKSGNLSQLATANYFYVPNFKRYYYISNITLGFGGIAEVIGRVDVLMSFKEEYIALQAILERQENTFNTYLNDEQFLTNNKTQTYVHLFKESLPEPKVYLITM